MEDNNLIDDSMIIKYYDCILTTVQKPVGIDKNRRIIYKNFKQFYPDNLQSQDPEGTFEGIPDICDG